LRFAEPLPGLRREQPVPGGHAVRMPVVRARVDGRAVGEQRGRAKPRGQGDNGTVRGGQA
jgi:hypothetical protein